LDPLLASEVKAEVAILLDWDNWWALELDGKPSNDLRLMPQITAYYEPLYRRNITVDFAHPESDLSKYKLVIAPNLYLVKDRAVENLNRYVENGGNLVTTFFSGIVDENEHIRLGGYPAPFREMLGLGVEEYVPYGTTEVNTINTADGKQFQCTFWGDVIHLKNAKAIATFNSDYYAGGAAMTHNVFGKGNTFYVGTVPDQNGIDWLLEQACKKAGIKPIATNPPADVEVLQRSSGNSSWLFVLNHSKEKVIVPFEQHGTDLLTGTAVNGSLELEPTGVAIVQIS
jgi:beta-galactosidase